MLAQDQLLGKRFEKCIIEKLIGRGGYGLSFLAYDEELQEHRVVKISQWEGSELDIDYKVAKSFVEEGLILSRLNHPQIVTLRGQGEQFNRRYMILDYIQGYNLKNILDILTRRQLELGCPWEELMDCSLASALILSILYPLEYAHRANVHLPDREVFGVAHRDIAPGNLILGSKGNEKGRVILIDFGTAKTDLSESITVNQNLVGTVPYMSKARLQKATGPDQIAQHRDFWKEFRETRHDIHALGVLYHQLLTGRLPFEGETTPQVIVQILEEQSYNKCHEGLKAFPPQIQEVIRKCIVFQDFSRSLNQQPFQYPHASSMLVDMENVFQEIFTGQSIYELLADFGVKLSEPEQILPSNKTSLGKRGFNPPPFLPIGTPPTHAKHNSDSVSISRFPNRYVILALGLTIIGSLFFWLSARFFTPSSGSEARSGSEETAGSEGFHASTPRHLVAGLERLEKMTDIEEKKPRTKTKEKRKPTPGAPPSTRPFSDVRPEKERRVQDGMSKSRHEKPASPSLPSLPASESTDSITSGPLGLIPSPLVPARMGKDLFVQLESMARTDEPDAYEKIGKALQQFPDSPDLRLLRCQLVSRRNPVSREARSELSKLVSASPIFIHPSIFSENVLFLLWNLDAQIFEMTKSSESRANLVRTGQAYLEKFGNSPANGEKVRAISAKIPQ